MRKFNNRENELITKENIGDRQIFNSRSAAVVGTILVHHLPTNIMYVLMGKRGTGTPDFQGLWNMPCGYLDWDETGTQAIYREIFEETGLDLVTLIENSEVVHNHMIQPWHVNFNTSNPKQNVTFRYGICVNTNDKLPTLTNAHCEPNEVEDLKWVNAKDIFNGEYDCAFGHDQLLSEFISLLNVYNVR